MDLRRSQDDLFRRLCAYGAAFIVVAGLIGTTTAAVAQNVPRLGPLARFEVSTRDSHGNLVFDIAGTPENPDIAGRFGAKGTVRFSPKLCAGKYRLRFVFTTIKGQAKKFPYPARIHRGRLDGTAQRCPFARLPRRGMKSMDVQATIKQRSVLHFVAKPFTRSGSPFARLKVKLSFRRPNTPSGALLVRIRVHYRSHSSHFLAFVADTRPRSVFRPNSATLAHHAT
jgi:hypothetical protein